MRAAVFIARRLLFAVVLLFTVSALVFGLQSFSKDTIVGTATAGRPVTPEQIAEIRAEYNLDDPLPARFAQWLGDAVRLDFGRSIASGESATSLIGSRISVTLELILLAVLLIVAIGVPLGMLAGIRSGTRADRIITVGAIVGLSAPVFATGILLIYVFGVYLGWLPVYGVGGPDPVDRLRHLLLPAIALAATLVAIVVRQTRAVTLTVMQQDYVTFARARGLSAPRILLAYAMRNVATTIVTVTGLLLIYLVGGTILVEQVFSIEGLGKLLVTSVQGSDVPVVQAIALVFAVFVVIVTLLVDLISMWIDPRTMYPAEG